MQTGLFSGSRSVVMGRFSLGRPSVRGLRQLNRVELTSAYRFLKGIEGMASTLIQKIKKLSPTDFENLVFDLVVSKGMRNVIWRTPGADGGRDIEAAVIESDFSGAINQCKWHIECKRYASAIDWPTMYGKISHAVVHRAQFLLLVTTSSLSPACLTNVTKWNAENHAPQIRNWSGHDFERLLQPYPQLSVKYGLATSGAPLAPAFFDLAVSASKTAQAAYGRSRLGADGGAGDNDEIELAACLAELLSAKMQQFSSTGTTNPVPFVRGDDGFSWAAFVDADYPFDRSAFRSLLSLIRLKDKSIALSIPALDAATKSVTIPVGGSFSDAEVKMLQLIAFWGHMELALTAGKIQIRGSRDGHD